ncbi:apolipoprotein acyltransferase [Thalassococcus sp. S3]|uniref:apolipoprotein acyltransferase n=1 Tax=Thalassococcus sp. S3 TaxID=2017482 RepID=UPI00102404C8|nr:apolipoprotein acyltransferase [Thalassococcus sp. S3]QBF31558.1 apolipoprotein acyltransferase [Thalassococcus sp. S3]
MIVIGTAILGAILGFATAKRRNGSRLDMAQYAAGYGIAFALLGLVATVTIHRMAV